MEQNVYLQDSNPCDTDYNLIYALVMQRKTIKELWNSEKYVNLRNFHLRTKEEI